MWRVHRYAAGWRKGSRERAQGVAGRPGCEHPAGPSLRGPTQLSPASRTHPRPGRGRPALRLLLACGGGGGGDCSGRGRDASCGCTHGRTGAGPMARLGSVPPGRSEGGGHQAHTSSALESGAVRPPEVNPETSAAQRLRSSRSPRSWWRRGT